TVAVGAILGSIADGQAATAAAVHTAKPAPEKKPAAAQQPAPSRSPNIETLAPSVRRIAEESGIDTATVTGSGKDNRLTKGDMLAVIEGGASPSSPISFGKIQAPPAQAPRAPYTRPAEARE